jgi:hypothetical protein
LQARRNNAEDALAVARRSSVSHLEQDFMRLGGTDGGAALARARLADETIAAETSLLGQVQSEWDLLVKRRQRANDACVAGLTGTQALGKTAPFLGGGVTTATPKRLLGLLDGLSATDLAIVLHTHPGLGTKLAAAAPDDVAAWWSGMNGPTPGTPSAAQAALIAALPAVIGNLGGIAYWARDTANNIALERAITSASQADTGNSVDLKSALALKSALGKGMHDSPPRQLVALTLTPDVRAALSVGDLDEALTTTHLVPGMGTNVLSDIGAYRKAADNLWRSQLKASGFSNQSAVVAWLDYSPPAANDVVGVANDYLAHAGAERLSGALEALRAARFAAGTEVEISVVAHSYGTTVAAIALTTTPADHFVMLGSAGIPASIEDSHSLEVPLGQVFASQGHHDGWAPTGQALSQRQDPTAPSFRAHVFSSETGEDEEGNRLNEVTQHGPLGSKLSPGSYSYFDLNTSALNNTALATSGRSAEIPMGGTPSERLALQLEDRAKDIILRKSPWSPLG